MADDIDLAQEREAIERDNCIANNKKPNGPTPTGYCHYCDEVLKHADQRFCNADCRDGWDKEQRLRGRK